MKKISILGASLLSMIAFVTVMFFHSCTKDDCQDVVCLNGGTCVSGTCECALGYEGADCTTKSNDKFAGTWVAADVCGSGAYSYNSTISSSATSANGVLINNFGGFGTNLTASATVEGSTLTIPSQDLGGILISGSGTISTDGNSLQMTYTALDSAGNTDVCSGSWTKQ